MKMKIPVMITNRYSLTDPNNLTDPLLAAIAGVGVGVELATGTVKVRVEIPDTIGMAMPDFKLTILKHRISAVIRKKHK